MWLFLLTFPTKNDMLKHIVDVKMKGKGMRMYQVSKRDGQIAPFNLSKISVAIEMCIRDRGCPAIFWQIHFLCRRDLGQKGLPHLIWQFPACVYF